MSLLPVVDALLELCEPSENGVAIDRSGAEPYDYEADHLYGWVDGHTQEIAGTGAEGAPGELLERFSIRLVFIVDNEGEEAKRVRQRSVSEALDEKAAKYLQTISRHSELTLGGVVMWESLTASADHDFIRQIERRGISIVATGWRMISG